MVSIQTIEAALEQVPDPELPISIVELGMVKTVSLEGKSARVHLLPTYTGCPALPVIEKDVVTKISAIEGVDECIVEWAYEPAWTPDRITPVGRDTLRAHGVTSMPCASEAKVTLTTSAITCPYCGSSQTRLDSPFGPTRCRSIHFCEACRNQFEHMKTRT